MTRPGLRKVGTTVAVIPVLIAGAIGYLIYLAIRYLLEVRNHSQEQTVKIKISSVGCPRLEERSWGKEVRGLTKFLKICLNINKN